MERLTSTTHTVRIQSSNPIIRFMSIVAFLILILLGFILAIPIVLIAIVVGLIAMLYFKIRSTLIRTKEPNGVFDGRQNVRVVNRDEPN